MQIRCFTGNSTYDLLIAAAAVRIKKNGRNGRLVVFYKQDRTCVQRCLGYCQRYQQSCSKWAVSRPSMTGR